MAWIQENINKSNDLLNNFGALQSGGRYDRRQGLLGRDEGKFETWCSIIIDFRKPS